jgi:hypothetical protein
MPNWYLNSMAGLSRFLRYAALRLFWTLRGPGRHNVIKTYRGGLKALKAHTSPRCCRRLKALKALRRTPSPALLRVCTCPPHCEGRWCQHLQGFTWCERHSWLDGVCSTAKGVREDEHIGPQQCGANLECRPRCQYPVLIGSFAFAGYSKGQAAEWPR